MTASRTAGYVALYRALEHIERRRPRLFADPYAEAFLPRGHRALLRVARIPLLHALISRYADRRAPGARTSAIARTRFIDDVVRRSAKEGIRQLVILGAGFDCRAHRLPELADVTVYEVDRAETQALKRSRVPSARIPAELRYLAVDFLRDETGVSLANAGWNAAEPTLFIWEGVTNYLDERAVTGVLSWVGGAAAGSTLVFTYIHARLLDGSLRFDGGAELLENVRALGEPWTFGLDPAALAPWLARYGLRLVEDLGADEYRRRYLPDGECRPAGYAFYRLAVATAEGRRPLRSDGRP